ACLDSGDQHGRLCGGSRGVTTGSFVLTASRLGRWVCSFSSTTKLTLRLSWCARPYPHPPFPAHPVTLALGHVVGPGLDLAQLTVPGAARLGTHGTPSPVGGLTGS